MTTGLGDAAEQARVAKIEEYRVLDEHAHPELAALVEVAATLADVPLAAIDVITRSHQHHVAAHGFQGMVCPRDDALCDRVLHEDAPVLVPDATLDPRFADNPFVTGELASVRFYGSHQLRSPDGHTIGTLCVFDTRPREVTESQARLLSALADQVVDVLELHLRTRELEQTQRELERSNRHLTAFAAQVSHDLRNPLTSMTMSLRMLAEHLDAGDGADPMARDLADRALRGTRRMTTMVEDLLDYASLGGDLRRTTVDLGQVLKQATEDLAAAGDVHVEPGHLPHVPGDPSQLRVLMQNLVGNALKFTRPDEPAQVRLGARRTPSGWRVEVSDAGPGIPEDLRESVFEELTRLDPSIPGTGIGLATCRRVVEAHGGSIGITDSALGGTTVWFELPC